MAADRQLHLSEDDKLRPSKVLPVKTSQGSEATAASFRHSEAVEGITANDTFHLLSGFVECANSIVFTTTDHVPFDSQWSGAVSVTAKCIYPSVSGFSASKYGGALAKICCFPAENRKELLHQVPLERSRFVMCTESRRPDAGSTLQKSRKTSSFFPPSLL